MIVGRQIPGISKFTKLVRKVRGLRDPAHAVAHAALIVWRDVDVAACNLACVEQALTKTVSLRLLHDAGNILREWSRCLTKEQQAAKVTEAFEKLNQTPTPDEVPPVILAAYDAFERELPELITKHDREWLAYHGRKRLAIGRTRTELLHQLWAEGYDDHELMVFYVEPDPEPALDEYEWERSRYR